MVERRERWFRGQAQSGEPPGQNRITLRTHGPWGPESALHTAKAFSALGLRRQLPSPGTGILQRGRKRSNRAETLNRCFPRELRCC